VEGWKIGRLASLANSSPAQQIRRENVPPRFLFVLVLVVVLGLLCVFENDNEDDDEDDCANRACDPSNAFFGGIGFT